MHGQIGQSNGTGDQPGLFRLPYHHSGPDQGQTKMEIGPSGPQLPMAEYNRHEYRISNWLPY